MYGLDCHHVWRSHDPTSARIFLNIPFFLFDFFLKEATSSFFLFISIEYRKIWSSPPPMCKGINQIVHGLELFNPPFKILKEVPALHFMTMFLYFVSCLVPHFTYRGCLTHYLLNLHFLSALWRPLKWRKVNIQLTLTHAN